MRDPKRIKRILKLIDELWEGCPDMRLGQLLENYVFGHHDERGCIFNIEDDVTEQNLIDQLNTKLCIACEKLRNKEDLNEIDVNGSNEWICNGCKEL